MCHERWARRRDEAVENTWLRSLYSRQREDAPTPREVSRPAERDPREDFTPANAPEPVGAR